MTGFTKGFRRHRAAGVERDEEEEAFCDEGEEDMSLRRVSYGEAVAEGGGRSNGLSESGIR
jgi:hypothetical protein